MHENIVSLLLHEKWLHAMLCQFNTISLLSLYAWLYRRVDLNRVDVFNYSIWSSNRPLGQLFCVQRKKPKPHKTAPTVQRIHLTVLSAFHYVPARVCIGTMLLASGRYRSGSGSLWTCSHVLPYRVITMWTRITCKNSVNIFNRSLYLKLNKTVLTLLYLQTSSKSGGSILSGHEVPVSVFPRN